MTKTLTFSQASAIASAIYRTNDNSPAFQQLISELTNKEVRPSIIDLAAKAFCKYPKPDIKNHDGTDEFWAWNVFTGLVSLGFQARLHSYLSIDARDNIITTYTIQLIED